MPVLENYVNAMPEAAFDEKRQLRDKTEVYRLLRQLAPNGYEIHTHFVGYTPDGRPYYVGSLTLKDEVGTITVPCIAEAKATEFNPNDPIGFSGLATMALTNGVLRGLGAAEWAYERNPAPAPQPAPRYAPAPTPQAAPARPAPAKGAGFKGSTAKPATGMRPWDGGVKVKSGEWAGTSYSELPDEVIEEWAGRGTNTAIMEKDRRMKERGEVPRSVFSK